MSELTTEITLGAEGFTAKDYINHTLATLIHSDQDISTEDLLAAVERVHASVQLSVRDLGLEMEHIREEWELSLQRIHLEAKALEGRAKALAQDAASLGLDLGHLDLEVLDEEDHEVIPPTTITEAPAQKGVPVDDGLVPNSG